MSDTSLNDNKVKYAGFGMRMLASVIDTALSTILLLPVMQIFYMTYGRSEMQESLASGAINAANISREQWIDLISYQIVSFTWQNIFIAGAVILFWVYRSATPGKMILKMQIVDAKTGGAPTKTQFIIRYIGYFISFLLCGLGFIWIYYDKKHQGFHDKIAGTIVVFAKKE